MMVKNIWIASDLPLNLVELIKKIFNDLEIKDNQIVNFDMLAKMIDMNFIWNMR